MTAGVSDDVAQELQMPIDPQALDDVEEPMPARPATFKDPGTPDQIVLDQHSLAHFPSPDLVQNVRRILEVAIHHMRTVENRRSGAPTSV